MRCESALRAMLEADREALRGAGDAALSEHLRTCRGCAHTAARLLDDELRLAAHLDGAAAAPHAARVDAIVRLSAGSHAGRLAQLRGRLRSARRGWWGAALAAAVVAALLLWPDARSVAPRGDNASRPTELSAPRIVPPAGHDVAVIRTRNPSITVVWLFEGAER